ncbi:hypothetical protein Tco_0992642 [Tanacetum coccineum]|uniref:Uncharacterized protein n=1 Tax=Tanacetum coccineum TaxID=301880 RepID=A0ABQ5F3D7_9ASTR
MVFGGNTRDLGSFGEETDEITNLRQILEEVLLTEHGDSVASIKRRRRDLFSDGVWNLETASGRGRLKEDLESSTYGYSSVGEELSLFDRPNEVERGRILEAHRLESILQQQISQRMAPSHHDGRKSHLLEDKQIPSVGVFDEVFSTWMTFRGNTHDLGSSGEETNEIIANLDKTLEDGLLTERGGLGVGSLLEKNLELYGFIGGFGSPCNSFGVGDTWCDIIKVVSYIGKIDNSFNVSFTLKVYNDLDVMFWSDPWCENGIRLMDMFPRLYALENNKECKVVERWILSNDILGGNWSWRLDYHGRDTDDLSTMVDLIGDIALSSNWDLVDVERVGFVSITIQSRNGTISLSEGFEDWDVSLLIPQDAIEVVDIKVVPSLFIMSEPLSLDCVFDFPMDEPEPHLVYDFFALGLLPGYAGNPNNNNNGWIEADVPLLGELGVAADEPMVGLIMDEIVEPIVEAEEQVIALVDDMDEAIAMLFSDDDFEDDDSEGFDEEEVWEVNEEWLMAPVTPPSMSVVPPPSVYKVGGPSTAAAEGQSFPLTSPGLPIPPSVIEDLSTRLGNLEYGHEKLVKKVIQVQALQAAVQQRDTPIQQLQTMVSEMSGWKLRWLVPRLKVRDGEDFSYIECMFPLKYQLMVVKKTSFPEMECSGSIVSSILDVVEVLNKALSDT